MNEPIDIQPAERGAPIDVAEQYDPCIVYGPDGQGTTQFGMQPCQVQVGVPPTVTPWLPETGDSTAGLLAGTGATFLLIGSIAAIIAWRPSRR